MTEDKAKRFGERTRGAIARARAAIGRWAARV